MMKGMLVPAKRMSAQDLRSECDPQDFDFETTDALQPLDEIIGQQQGVASVRFGVGMAREGFNIFAMGRPGVGKNTLVRQYLDRRAPGRRRPTTGVT